MRVAVVQCVPKYITCLIRHTLYVRHDLPQALVYKLSQTRSGMSQVCSVSLSPRHTRRHFGLIDRILRRHAVQDELRPNTAAKDDITAQPAVRGAMRGRQLSAMGVDDRASGRNDRVGHGLYNALTCALHMARDDALGLRGLPNLQRIDQRIVFINHGLWVTLSEAVDTKLYCALHLVH